MPVADQGADSSAHGALCTYRNMVPAGFTESGSALADSMNTFQISGFEQVFTNRAPMSEDAISLLKLAIGPGAQEPLER